MKLLLAALVAAMTCYAQTKEAAPRKDLTEAVQQRMLRIQAQKTALQIELAAAKLKYDLQVAPLDAENNEVVAEQCARLDVPADKTNECLIDPNKKLDAKFGEVRWEKPAAKPEPAPVPASNPTPAPEPSK